MVRARPTVCGFVAAIAAAACSVLPMPKPADEAPSHAGIDGVACVGNVAALPAGLTEQPDEGLLREAQGASGKGNICFGRVFVVRESVQVHRLWEEQRQNMHGQWWTFTVPQGSRESYREAHAICRSWNALDRAVSCTLKPGTRIVVGPGQSADCEEKTYPKSAVNQVYVPSNRGSADVPVENCSTQPWP
jgi:hypothetical protein